MCCFAGYLIRCQVDQRKALPSFIHYFSLSNYYSNWLGRATIRATIQNVNAEKYKELALSLPPLPEQRRIVAHLDSVCSELDAAEAAIRKQIALLQELRTRLVSDAVTGAVEV